MIDGVAARFGGEVGRLDDGGTMIKFRLTEEAENMLRENFLRRSAA